MNNDDNNRLSSAKAIPLRNVLISGGIGVLALIMVVWVGRGDDSSQTTKADISERAPATTSAESAAVIKAKVHDYAVDPITSDQYPEFYKKLGKDASYFD
ncbi:hypothetical protein CWC46_09350 [Prodigiosinella confusarubida]|uniref:Uncharacterized protein n=1 Tax=Serratia sp. (strain ATCC 39006) TaxID=104623 RepID=A0A2I5T600_SERS3|nr:hypothetical protein [Serratia sp. ATCC 39006]AUG99987.1 hypothetical protein CWC46_09350 [Serratia sp. ATCC 39006]AUH04307.1 hypothetical protein Ser39006_009355 [Serratia sp. ATCC 39006]